MAKLKFLFLDILTDDAETREENEKLFSVYGGYAGLMHSCLGLENELEVVEAGFCPLAYLDDLLYYIVPGIWDGIIMGGSLSDIGPSHKIAHWQAQVFRFITRACRLNVPVLGICGGHQYAARALNGSAEAVVQNPLGSNRGSSKVILTNEGGRHPLFKGCSNESLFQWNHAFVVMKLPDGAVRLAVHPKSINAAFQCGSFIGVQWHPEFGALESSGYGVKLMQPILASYIEDSLDEIEKNELKQAYGGLRPAPDSAKIFANWVEMVRTGFFQGQ